MDTLELDELKMANLELSLFLTGGATRLVGLAYGQLRALAEHCDGLHDQRESLIGMATSLEDMHSQLDGFLLELQSKV